MLKRCTGAAKMLAFFRTTVLEYILLQKIKLSRIIFLIDILVCQGNSFIYFQKFSLWNNFFFLRKYLHCDSYDDHGVSNLSKKVKKYIVLKLKPQRKNHSKIQIVTQHTIQPFTHTHTHTHAHTHTRIHTIHKDDIWQV